MKAPRLGPEVTGRRKAAVEATAALATKAGGEGRRGRGV